MKDVMVVIATWNSHSWLVQKTDGSWWITVDCYKHNQIVTAIAAGVPDVVLFLKKINTSPPTVWPKPHLCNNSWSFYPHLPFLCSLKETSFQALIRCFSRTLAHHLLRIPALWTKSLFHAPTPGSWFIGLSCRKENELGAGQFPLCCYSMGSITPHGQPAVFLWMHNPFS